ncbi:MAG: AlpA family phage regulatory protein [Hyphomicrobiaceae bacterium]|nr:AlpA family phage regulatory protein [Hyphomicrobiaceae bacterium]
MSEEKRARHVIRGWDGIRTFTGYGRTQLQDMIARGDFPAPMKLGPRAVGWFEETIRVWQDQIARDGGA